MVQYLTPPLFLPPRLFPSPFLSPPHTHTHTHTLLTQGVVGTEHSLKTALVSLFVEGGVPELENDEKGKHSRSQGYH